MFCIYHIRLVAYNPKANNLIERRGVNWFQQLLIVLLGRRMRSSEDDGSCFSNVFGEQPIIPNVLPSNFDMKELSVELHKLYHQQDNICLLYTSDAADE